MSIVDKLINTTSNSNGISFIKRDGVDKISINGGLYDADDYVNQYCEEQEHIFNLREYGSFSTQKFIFLMELSVSERKEWYIKEINKSLDSGFVIFHPYVTSLFNN
jgi:hypothetical protein